MRDLVHGTHSAGHHRCMSMTRYQPFDLLLTFYPGILERLVLSDSKVLGNMALAAVSIGAEYLDFYFSY
jgi:hypothetical protein